MDHSTPLIELSAPRSAHLIGHDETLAAERTSTAELKAVHLAEVLLDVNEEGRARFLRYLDLMNISYRTLFPDLTGATMHCNLALEIEGY